MRTDWLKYPYYTLPDPGLVDVPQPGGRTTKMASVEYTMAESISQDIRGYRKFLYAPADMDPQDRNPAAVRNRLIEFAKTLRSFSYSSFITPADWDPVEAGTRYANILFEILKNIPVNANYPESNNVYDAWIDGTGQLYGGVRPGVK